MLGTTGILAVLICVSVSRSAAIKCLSCIDAARPRDCQYLQECGPHEKCSIEAYGMTSGSVTYSVGCMDSMKCAAVGRRRSVLNVTVFEMIQQKDGFATIPEDLWDQSQRDMLVCAECCDTELCNIKGCGEQGLPPDSGPVCYGCQSERYPDQCNKIILCDRDYACHLSTNIIGVDLVYSSGCKHTKECSQLGILNIGAFDLVGRRSDFVMTSKVERSAVCNKCCTSNLCNSDTCSSLSHISITSTIPAPTKVNGGWNGWSHWGLCSVTCGGGQHHRDRVCNNPSPANGGYLCSGRYRETQSCNEHPCIVNGGWSVWSQWSHCSVTCGDGQHYRDRVCNNPSPANGGHLCSGTSRHIQTCHEHACVVNGGWSVWSQWSLCSVSCGGGQHYRDRVCNNPSPANGGQLCSGQNRETQSCNEHACVVNGGFNVWSQWSFCSLTCGGGEHYRDRACNNPSPSNGGQLCSGPYRQIQSCNEHPCVVNGGWNVWSQWSLCSLTCGGGEHYRDRACNNPIPANGGQLCSGPYRQIQSCNEQPCVGGCLYKGHAYQEGHNWQDGCNYICACVDGNIGVYKCYPLCPTWNLPSVCIMEPPAPGRCCPQPKCPDNIRIDYPVGYQDH